MLSLLGQGRVSPCIRVGVCASVCMRGMYCHPGGFDRRRSVSERSCVRSGLLLIFTDRVPVCVRSLIIVCSTRLSLDTSRAATACHHRTQRLTGNIYGIAGSVNASSLFHPNCFPVDFSTCLVLSIAIMNHCIFVLRTILLR